MINRKKAASGLGFVQDNSVHPQGPHSKRTTWKASQILFLNSCPASLWPTLQVRHALVKRNGKVFSEVSSDWFNQTHTEHKPVSEEWIRVEGKIGFYFTAFPGTHYESEPAFAKVLHLTSKRTHWFHLLKVRLHVTPGQPNANGEQRVFQLARDGLLLSRGFVTNHHHFQRLHFAVS